MLKTVEPHDLLGACKECGITLTVLCDRTGIPEDELLAFASGHSALLARDRFAILVALTDDLPPVRYGSPQFKSVFAAGMLIGEVEEEHRQEDEDDAK